MKSLPPCNEIPEEENKEFYQEQIDMALSMNFIEEDLCETQQPLKGNERILVHIFARKE